MAGFCFMAMGKRFAEKAIALIRAASSKEK